ncbi:sulfite exporter TauE/SafE family protein [Halomonas dongshanensis]|uniref:Probable membrane transporter protein n=1 Tax=Halomonas dongshanensis TaxID=2890835 RepID=A0ABT2EDA4_9GAMM|nr:sulfite exporter TauE/SafE family protein [Halomonas dongshanensis]MCS2609571.1 sulfite exporter TauE/SafE family protein [Halomonas dongshanensis]
MMSSLPHLWPAVGLACFAGAVRGYCGFGFAMLLALGLMLFLPPIEAVPLALLLDLVTSIGLWHHAVRSADWPRLMRLLVGMLVATVVGVWLIAILPASQLRVAIALLALGGALALLLRRESAIVDSPPRMPGPSSVAAGGVSGLCMTLASSGGPPLMLYLLHQRLPPIALRATAILFFAASSSASLIGLGLAGELGRDTLLHAAWLLVPALVGNAIGQWAFERSPPRSLKYTVAPLLMLLSAWVLVREWL